MKPILPLLVMLLAATAAAREYSPRIVSAERADAYSMKTFARFPRWKDLRGDALAWEVYRYLADTRSGVFHMNEVLEGRDALGEYRTVRDPVKIINVYGYAYCAALGPVMAGIWEDMGQGKARTVTLPGWSHVVSEVFYDDAWHYMDLDVRAVFRRDDGRLASLDEARRDESLWKNRGPLFFPNDPLDQTRRIYQKTRLDHYHGFNQSGHTMDYVLRQGETFTRWWTPQGGRWHHAAEYNRQDWLRRLIEQAPRGPKPNHRHFTVHNYGNGRFIYRPDLTRRSTDFDDGVYDARNVRPGAEGLTLTQPGEGFAVFEVRSPYVIVPLVGSLDTTDDDREASVVEIDAAGASLAVSLDNGLTWQGLDAAASVDLTRHVSGTYGYLLRITLRGRPGEAVLRRLGITTWVQAAPAALPALVKGTNRLEYRAGDHYALSTRVVEVRSEANRPEALLKHLVEPPADYDPNRKTARICGAAVVKVEPPPGATIAWFSAQGSFATHQRQAARNTRNTIGYAVDEPRDFREIYRAAVPTDTEHWHCNAHREVKLDRPARRLFVRYVGDPALNNFHIYAHCLDDARRSARPVTVTHAWREGQVRRSKTVTLDRPGPYEIAVGSEPVNESIELTLPSDGRN
ncbi:MAG: hypothetical protein BWX88_03350 [Planctomycetes bacterium ADurb.Bin126]|nr:MAG: hypothetical protein BWX88_03350 [Planctomycetes bacterium ADurb.Bin126]HOD80041.1 hypothetical protein [Phycisphaerae bacterium]HQL73130.1 hypothetical protein [Phycisphaerae bacterium]